MTIKNIIFIFFLLFSQLVLAAANPGPASKPKAGEGGGSSQCSPQQEFGGGASGGGGAGVQQARMVASPAVNGTGSGPTNGPGNQFEQLLRGQIRTSGLASVLPTEFAQCSNAENGWFEFMRGLAFIESSWDSNCNNPNDANGKPSTGLFQMTAGDTAKGKSCFSSQEETKDAKKNIECAVDKMAELMGAGGGSGGGAKVTKASASGSAGGGLEKAGQYWGPIKRNDPKVGKIVEIVKSQACQGGGQPLNWPQLLSGGDAKGTSAPKPSNGTTSI